MKKVAFIDVVHPVLFEGLNQLGFECINLTNISEKDIRNQISFFHGIVIRSRFTLTREFLMHAENLEFIARSGAGLENIDKEYCKENNIELINAPEGNRNAVAEHALGMLLSLFNNLVISNAQINKGIWEREENRGVELDGKVVGIIGYGNNGRAFAEKLRGFDVNILAYDKYKSNFGTKQVNEVDLNSIFENADILSLHIPQNEETQFMVNASFIANFKKPFYLINLSRGKIVKTNHLVNGLKEGKILGACLDVLEYEKASFENLFDDKENIPSSLNYLIKNKKVIMSPHVGGWTHQSYFKLSEVLLNKIKAYYSM